ncbi:hypothetical protein [Candidatus Ornithobacterium hominis]|uniref:hypothetical protein n=1 Tax=Candidatus Ornithobacterium hominis TaxID=2497989 RepID=UPI001401F232|nr:hypothetical protein [Candidatus Ornithobacterium hominis]
MDYSNRNNSAIIFIKLLLNIPVPQEHISFSTYFLFSRRHLHKSKTPTRISQVGV